jgi:hypothetical protein
MRSGLMGRRPGCGLMQKGSASWSSLQSSEVHPGPLPSYCHTGQPAAIELARLATLGMATRANRRPRRARAGASRRPCCMLSSSTHGQTGQAATVEGPPVSPGAKCVPGGEVQEVPQDVAGAESGKGE